MSRTLSRRTVLRGVGVTMALPWLESLPAWGQTNAANPAGTFPKRFAVLFMGNGINGNHWWARGNGAAMKLSRVAGAARTDQDEDQRDQRPVQPAGRWHGHSPGTDGQSAVGRADSEGRDHQGGDYDGSGPRQSHRPGHPTPQHRPRLRAADDRLPRDELLDGLQLAHLVAKRGVAGPERGLPVAGVRQPVRESRQPALSEHPRPGARSRRDA